MVIDEFVIMPPRQKVTKDTFTNVWYEPLVFIEDLNPGLSSS
jgi:homogentisate 1,2-dioxygenase